MNGWMDGCWDGWMDGQNGCDSSIHPTNTVCRGYKNYNFGDICRSTFHVFSMMDLLLQLVNVHVYNFEHFIPYYFGLNFAFYSAVS